MADNESPRAPPPADIDAVAWFINRSLTVSTGALPWAVVHFVTTWELLSPVVPVLTVVSVVMRDAMAAGAVASAARARRERWIGLLGFMTLSGCWVAVYFGVWVGLLGW
jgi:hypothetical protein